MALERREGSEDPWLCVSGFRQICLFRWLNSRLFEAGVNSGIYLTRASKVSLGPYSPPSFVSFIWTGSADSCRGTHEVSDLIISRRVQYAGKPGTNDCRDRRCEINHLVIGPTLQEAVNDSCPE